jgi:hypothetical protein
MKAEEMSQKILDYIDEYGDASFANLMRLLGEDAKGDLGLEILPNVFLWADMSQSLIDALAAIQHLLEIRVTSVLVYLVDGHSLNLPTGKRIPKNGVRKPRWVPVVLRRRRDGEAANTDVGNATSGVN